MSVSVYSIIVSSGSEKTKHDERTIMIAGCHKMINDAMMSLGLTCSCFTMSPWYCFSTS